MNSGTLPTINNKEHDMPEGWTKTELGSFILSMANGVYKPEGSYADDGVACLRMYNIEEGRIAWRNIKRMRLTPAEIDQYRLASDDLLVNRVNSRELVGKTALCDGLPELAVFESKNIRVRLNTRAIDPRFVNYWLRADANRRQLTDSAKQTVGMATISQPQLCALFIHLPPICEQNRIVTKIDELLARVNVTRERLAKVSTTLMRFRQSVLAAACSGRLSASWRQAYYEYIEEDDTIPSRWEWVELNELIPKGGIFDDFLLH